MVRSQEVLVVVVDVGILVLVLVLVQVLVLVVVVVVAVAAAAVAAVAGALLLNRLLQLLAMVLVTKFSGKFHGMPLRLAALGPGLSLAGTALGLI